MKNEIRVNKVLWKKLEGFMNLLFDVGYVHGDAQQNHQTIKENAFLSAVLSSSSSAASNPFNINSTMDIVQYT